MLLGIVLHSLMSFMPCPWPVQDSRQNDLFFIPVAAIHLFRMPLFFLLGGFFAMFVLRKQGLRGMLQHRTQRILLPRLLALITIVPLSNFLRHGEVNSQVAEPRHRGELAEAIVAGDLPAAERPARPRGESRGAGQGGANRRQLPFIRPDPRSARQRGIPSHRSRRLDRGNGRLALIVHRVGGRKLRDLENLPHLGLQTAYRQCPAFVAHPAPDEEKLPEARAADIAHRCQINHQVPSPGLIKLGVERGLEVVAGRSVDPPGGRNDEHIAVRGEGTLHTGGLSPAFPLGKDFPRPRTAPVPPGSSLEIALHRRPALHFVADRSGLLTL